jgi:hypothetical protein
MVNNFPHIIIYVAGMPVILSACLFLMHFCVFFFYLRPFLSSFYLLFLISLIVCLVPYATCCTVRVRGKNYKSRSSVKFIHYSSASSKSSGELNPTNIPGEKTVAKSFPMFIRECNICSGVQSLNVQRQTDKDRSRKHARAFQSNTDEML